MRFINFSLHFSNFVTVFVDFSNCIDFFYIRSFGRERLSAWPEVIELFTIKITRLAGLQKQTY